MLLIVWSGAVLGVLFRVLWVSAPRWLYTPVYVALGWVAVFYLGPLVHFGGWAIVTLIAVGGLLYTLGAVVYGLKRPNPSPRWFGFHEIFHTLTVAAFAVHYVAASMTLYGRSA
jgi:hemolysin III